MPQSNPIRWREALRAMGKLLEDPEDTRQVFLIIEALTGNAHVRMLRRIKSRPLGSQLLRKMPDLLSVLQDRKALEALPEDSLGRAYLRFIDSEGITPDGLVSASETGTEWVEREASLTRELEYFGDRMRDMHDVWHTVTGYKGDLVGEACVLAFSFAQTRNPGVGFIVLVGYLVEGGRLGARGHIVEAFRRGLRAEPFTDQPWEELLALPLEEVRRRLNVGAPPEYQAVRSGDLPPMRLAFS